MTNDISATRHKVKDQSGYVSFASSTRAQGVGLRHTLVLLDGRGRGKHPSVHRFLRHAQHPLLATLELLLPHLNALHPVQTDTREGECRSYMDLMWRDTLLIGHYFQRGPKQDIRIGLVLRDVGMSLRVQEYSASKKTIQQFY